VIYTLGQAVPLAYQVNDEDGNATSPTTAVLTVTKPDDTTETPTITEDQDTVGLFELDYVPSAAGLYSAVFVTTGPNGADAVSWIVQDIPADTVTLASVKTYLGDISDSDAEIQSALDAERHAQAVRCDVDPYGPDLAEALKRRVARNLAARRVPVASFTTFDGGATSSRAPGRDPEIERLEKPHRRLVAR